MNTRFHVLSRQEARAAVGDGALRPSAIISISGNEEPDRVLQDAGVPLLSLHFDDVPRNGILSYNAVTREQVEQLLTWWSQHRADGDVIVHCAAGISRSSACALALIAANYGDGRHEGARSCVLDLLAAVHDTHRQSLREDVGIRPNPRIVWFADQILGWDGHLLAVVEDVFAMRGVWVDLGEDPPENWPGKAA